MKFFNKSILLLVIALILQIASFAQTVPTDSQTGIAGNLKTVSNSFGMKFVLIPHGTFKMGSETSGEKNETPAHQVTISKDFFLEQTKVTMGQWNAVMGTRVATVDGNRSVFLNGTTNVGFKEGDEDYPMHDVSWNQVKDFIKTLNSKAEGTYRLPTEAEWEYAARAGTTTTYSFGDKTKDLDDYAWYKENSTDNDGHTKLYAVASKKANPWGLYDMYGSVWEFCEDWYNADYYSKSPAVDPQGPVAARDYSDEGGKVIRGGGFTTDAEGISSAARSRISATDLHANDVGFRLVKIN